MQSHLHQLALYIGQNQLSASRDASVSPKPQVMDTSPRSLDNKILCQGRSRPVSISTSQPQSEPFGFASSLAEASDSGISLAEKTKSQAIKLAQQEQRILEMDIKITYVERKLKEQTTQVQQMHNVIKDLESRCSNGHYTWVIKEFSQKRHEAKTGTGTVLHSTGFYTSFRGYKMCLRINLNGVETGFGTHLSLFVHLMRGEFDDNLVWPFTGKIILIVSDQSDAKNDIVETLVGNGAIAAFHKPSSSRNHKGFGYMEFVPLSRIDNSVYVKNNTLIIRCQVQESSK